MKNKIRAKLKLNIGLAEKYSEFSEDHINKHELEDGHMLDVSSAKEKTKSAEFDFSPGAIYFNDEILVNRDDFDITKINENMYISNLAAASNPLVLAEHGITHVVNLVAHKKQEPGLKGSGAASDKSYMTASTGWGLSGEEKENEEGRQVKSLELSLKDTPDSDLLSIIEKVYKFIEVEKEKFESPKFLFFCTKGISRSASVCAGYLICTGKSFDEALETIRSKRPEIDPNIGFLGQLKILEEQQAGEGMICT
ncbi:unnamed protein product [Moneuplotes crassus]|uniref:Protein-tyrosine-phosphatase n=2 Tax=Euplotes crassus TaxID=5936 RepID=A0AAD1XMP6_EUPCR|nr:unnamed protein product [Moneuplotes crassus]